MEKFTLSLATLHIRFQSVGVPQVSSSITKTKNERNISLPFEENHYLCIINLRETTEVEQT